jgi:hypothetical protein
MDGTWATSAAKLGTRVVLPDQFQVLLDHCRRPTRGHPASLQGQLHPKRIISFVIDEPDTEAHSLTTNSRNVG